MTSLLDPAAAEAEARRLYDAGASFPKIADAWGCAATTARTRAKGLEWPPREAKKPPGAGKKPARKKIAVGKARPAQRKSKPAALPVAEEPQTPPLDTRELSRRVEASVRNELSAVERRLASATPASAERNARTLASLVKSLAELRKLERDDSEHKRNERDGDEDTQPPVDMARLRQKLEDNLARLRAERDADIAQGRDTV